MTLHSLYLVSHRPCSHYIWSPTEHGNAIILVNVNC
ncbi:unnamed protein product [Staurois parvus]|uniref:Uncharacterized protein n=1 Tax=Staurois parvus TaxID=386267 RepID=A0ABN9CHK5_9NEOB|nr:unnamed protein product [Staurois parvus]